MFTFNPYANDLARVEQACLARRAEFYAPVHAELRRRRRTRHESIARSVPPLPGRYLMPAGVSLAIVIIGSRGRWQR
jgi:hypothetical protein